MPWSSYGNVATPGFVADISSTWRSFGRQVNWSEVVVGRVNAITGKKEIPAGTIMAVQADGKMIPRDDVAGGGETSTEILIGTAIEDAAHHAKSGYGTYVGGVFYINLMPDYGDGSLSTWQTELGTKGPFVWLTYEDSSVTYYY